MKKMLYLLVSLSIWFGYFAYLPQGVLATETGAGFTITAVLGSGQIAATSGYASLKVAPNHTYPISVRIENLSQQASQFQTRVVAATTSNAGQINYAPSRQKRLSGQAPLLPDLVTAKPRQTLTIAPKTAQTVTFKIKIPAEGFKGHLLGSIYVVKQTAPSETSSQKGFGMRNRFAMTAPVVVTQNPTEKLVPKLKLTRAKLASQNGLPQVTGQISNTAPVMFGNIKTSAQVINRTTKKVLYERQTEHGEMAPRSAYRYAIETEQQLLPVGRYTMKVQVTSGAKKFNLQQHFSVDKTKREIINQQLRHPEQQSINWWLWLTVGVIGVLIIALGAYISGRKRGVGK